MCIYMIQVFRESGELLTSFKTDTLPRTVAELKAFITRENIIGHD
jgi:sorbitol-specific phosphotransferase system component IIC